MLKQIPEERPGGLAADVAGRTTWGLREGPYTPGREVGTGSVGHGEPVKAVEQGQPWAC